MSFSIDDKVRLRERPDRQGTITGRKRVSGSYTHWEVRFGPGDARFHLEDALVPADDEQTIDDLMRAGVFAGPKSLRRLLTYERLQSGLTDFFYSMESNRTDFLPHQFKPVLKFINSADGRLLIADEVGLGKTIEAMYIWRELQARIDARRLLVVCPAKLRNKWRMEIRHRFGVTAEIVDAKRFLELLTEVNGNQATSFIAIAGLESIRPPRQDRTEAGSQGAKAQIAALLRDHRPFGEEHIFDLVVIDEAHYLRNRQTSHFELGRLLRDASRHMTLLSATPVQTGVENLHALLDLLDPEAYPSWQRDFILAQHRACVRAMRLLWATPVDVDALNAALDAVHHAPVGLAISTVAPQATASDAALDHLRMLAADPSLLTPESRIEACRQLDAISPLGSRISRSLKRHVLQNRVVRTANTRKVTLTDLELEAYSSLSNRILVLAYLQGKGTVAHLMLVARQRQLASSFVAALQAWKGTELLEDEDLADDDSDNQWLATVLRADPGMNEQADVVIRNLAEFERVDSKYATLWDYLTELHSTASSEKVIIFAYFRATLRYLERRLVADGLGVVRIDGETPVDGRTALLQRFEWDASVTVLLSSEVGAEGIDLQFCRVVVNYDLPWNPMKVEQRIGRIDRLGQRSERITVVNLYCEQTVEDRVVSRLYDRLGVFKECIGDLEEVLGEQVSDMIVQTLDPRLTEVEREERLRLNELALAQTVSTQRDVESEAANLAGFYDYILEMVQGDHNGGRWLASEDLREFVCDFLLNRFRGIRVERLEEAPSDVNVELSDDARRELSRFLGTHAQVERTRLDAVGVGPIRLTFDPKSDPDATGQERVTFSHPLIGWIRATYRNEPRSLVRAVAVGLQRSSVVAPGLYVIRGLRWHLEAVQKEIRIVYRAVKWPGDECLDARSSESLIQEAATQGLEVNGAVRDQWPDLSPQVDRCWVALDADIERRRDEFLATNDATVNRMILGVERARDRRLAVIHGAIRDLEFKLIFAADEKSQEAFRRKIAAQKAQATKAEKSATERLATLTGLRELHTFTFDEILGCVIQVGESP